MSVFEIIKKRKSIRKYAEGEIPSEHLIKILTAAQLAPSASNRQPYCFIVVQDAETRKKIGKKANFQKFIAKAGVIIVGLADPSREKWYKVDIAIAMEHMVLVATELDYGTCWIGSFDANAIKNLLNIPNDLEIVALLPIGLAAESPNVRPRKKFENLFFSEKFGNTIAY
ncbi:MAG: nitroreductase family protein [Candidatus Helarchaeota archaeon]